MPRPHTDPRGQNQKIAAELRAQIMAGDLAPGTQLPAISELVVQFGVANMTIQAALRTLKAEGFLVSRQGRGNFVRDSPQQAVDTVATVTTAGANGTYAWITEAARKGVVGTTQILEVGEVVAPHQVREALRLASDDETVVLRKRLMLFDGVPAEIAWSYYPMDLARGTDLLGQKKIKGGSPALLAEMGYPPVEMVDLVSWRPPTEEEFVLLELPVEVPIGRTFRVIYSRDHRPIEAAVLVKAGHLHELLYRVPLE